MPRKTWMTEEIIPHILKMWGDGVPTKDIARHYGTSEWSVSTRLKALRDSGHEAANREDARRNAVSGNITKGRGSAFDDETDALIVALWGKRSQVKTIAKSIGRSESSVRHRVNFLIKRNDEKMLEANSMRQQHEEPVLKNMAFISARWGDATKPGHVGNWDMSWR